MGGGREETSRGMRGRATDADPLAGIGEIGGGREEGAKGAEEEAGRACGPVENIVGDVTMGGDGYLVAGDTR